MSSPASPSASSDPYSAGDLLWVEGGIEGRVIQVNWRSTHIATINKDVAVVPNSVMAKARLVQPQPADDRTRQFDHGQAGRPRIGRPLHGRADRRREGVHAA